MSKIIIGEYKVIMKYKLSGGMDGGVAPAINFSRDLFLRDECPEISQIISPKYTNYFKYLNIILHISKESV